MNHISNIRKLFSRFTNVSKVGTHEQIEPE
jgi:hypothetical protein